MPYRFPEVECSNCKRFRDELPWMPVLTVGTMRSFVHPRQRSRGALVIAPARHILTLAELSADETRDLATILRVLTVAISSAFSPDGMHTFCNNGVLAGQSEPHLHFQLTPRYRGALYSYGPSESIPLTAERVQEALAEQLLASIAIQSERLT